MSKLQHRSVVRFREAFVRDDTTSVCIVMDLYRGGNVVGALTRFFGEHGRPFIAEECVHPAFQMATAVRYLHSLRIMHRDVKGDNFLCSGYPISGPECHIVLSDFGLAAQLETEEERRVEQCGSPEYWAPEIHALDYGLKVDVFALGVTIFGMVTGRMFCESSEASGLRRRPNLARAVAHRSLRDFLESALHGKEKDRMSAAEFLRHPWLCSVDGCRQTDEAEPALVAKAPRQAHRGGGSAPAPGAGGQLARRKRLSTKMPEEPKSNSHKMPEEPGTSAAADTPVGRAPPARRALPVLFPAVLVRARRAACEVAEAPEEVEVAHHWSDWI